MLRFAHAGVVHVFRYVAIPSSMLSPTSY